MESSAPLSPTSAEPEAPRGMFAPYREDQGRHVRMVAFWSLVFFVGFGCPKQEKWINMHYRSLGVPVSVGIGGTIDFLAGRLARARYPVSPRAPWSPKPGAWSLS